MYDCYEINIYISENTKQKQSYLAFCDHAKGLTDISIPFFKS